MQIDKKTIVVITGAGSGIGRALALNLGADCGGLALADVDSEGLAETARLAETAFPGCRITTHRLDVSDREAMTAFAAEVEASHGGAGLLINNAGVAIGGTVRELSIDDIDWLMGINFRGVVYGVKLFLPLLSRAPRAHIVNISSVFGMIAPPGQAAYAASKFAVRGFTEALRHELEGSGITVSTVHPGGIRTNIARRARIAEGADEALLRSEQQTFDRAARTTPERAAEVIRRGIEAGRERILIGPDAWLIDRLQRLLPVSYWKLMGPIFKMIRNAKS